jgi:hypothetical protein
MVVSRLDLAHTIARLLRLMMRREPAKDPR